MTSREKKQVVERVKIDTYGDHKIDDARGKYCTADYSLV